MSAIAEEMEYNKLVRDCIANKQEAQKQLYEHFSEIMLGICYRYTKSIRDAEDVLQEGFVKVFRNLHQYKNEGELGAWIRRIMINTALNFLKKNRKYQDDMAFTGEHMHPVTNDDPEMTLNSKELADLIRQLPSGYQTIFNLYAVEGYSHIEIGEMLGISDGTSRSQYARARALLATWIKKHYSEVKSKTYAGK